MKTKPNQGAAMNWIKKLRQLGACGESIEWAEATNHATLQRAWAACDRGDWMLWLAGKLTKTEDDRKTLALAACACARLSLIYVPAGEPRPLATIETTERWAWGWDKIADVGEAAAHAYACARAYACVISPADAAAECAAATAAACAAHTAAAGADDDDALAAAHTATACACAAACAAHTADDTAAYATVLKRCADLVRVVYPEPSHAGTPHKREDFYNICMAIRQWVEK